MQDVAAVRSLYANVKPEWAHSDAKASAVIEHFREHSGVGLATAAPTAATAADWREHMFSCLAERWGAAAWDAYGALYSTILDGDHSEVAVRTGGEPRLAPAPAGGAPVQWEPPPSTAAASGAGSNATFTRRHRSPPTSSRLGPGATSSGPEVLFFPAWVDNRAGGAGGGGGGGGDDATAPVKTWARSVNVEIRSDTTNPASSASVQGSPDRPPRLEEKEHDQVMFQEQSTEEEAADAVGIGAAVQPWSIMGCRRPNT
eukprot:SAG22_NODE_2230_length_2811_cov_1.654499_1_plen_258_part_00